MTRCRGVFCNAAIPRLFNVMQIDRQFPRLLWENISKAEQERTATSSGWWDAFGLRRCASVLILNLAVEEEIHLTSALSTSEAMFTECIDIKVFSRPNRVRIDSGFLFSMGWLVCKWKEIKEFFFLSEIVFVCRWYLNLGLLYKFSIACFMKPVLITWKLNIFHACFVAKAIRSMFSFIKKEEIVFTVLECTSLSRDIIYIKNITPNPSSISPYGPVIITHFHRNNLLKTSLAFSPAKETLFTVKSAREWRGFLNSLEFRNPVLCTA